MSAQTHLKLSVCTQCRMCSVLMAISMQSLSGVQQTLVCLAMLCMMDHEMMTVYKIKQVAECLQYLAQV